MTQNKQSAIGRTKTLGRALIGASALTLGSTLSAETSKELNELIVSALRMPNEVSKTTSAVTALDPRDLEERGILDLRQALNEAPGIIATSTAGQAGAIGSVFIRGTTTASSQLIVDGMRLSDSNAQLGNFFSGARMDDLERVEVLRGAQSAIHGGDAIGGVIWLETARGQGDPRTRIRTEAGSFDSLNGYVSHSGQENSSSWFVGGGYDGTHNDAVDQNFDQARAALRYEWAQEENLSLGITFRATDARYQYDSYGTNTDHTDTDLSTIYANAHFTPDWFANFTLGRYRESYDNDSAYGNYGTDLDRSVLSTNQSIEINRQHRLLGGAFLEFSDFFTTSGTDWHESRYGGNLGWEWSPYEGLVTDAVVRWEDYAKYEEQVTWRVGSSWQFLEASRLRTGIGKAFRTPTLLDLYGSPFGAGNPTLRAEESIGWDFGIEQNFGDAHLLSVTWFENSIENTIDTSPLPPTNTAGSTSARGLEFAANGAISESVSYRAAWTWLGASLDDQPDNTATASIDWRPSEKLLCGIGASHMDDRSFGGKPMGEYILVRLYGSYEINEAISLNARVENLGDQKYELGNFSGNIVQGAGLGFFTGITAEF
jgi:vitamin B12 transporter